MLSLLMLEIYLQILFECGQETILSFIYIDNSKQNKEHAREKKRLRCVTQILFFYDVNMYF